MSNDLDLEEIKNVIDNLKKECNILEGRINEIISNLKLKGINSSEDAEKVIQKNNKKIKYLLEKKEEMSNKFRKKYKNLLKQLSKE